ncbi:MAG: CoA-binding protein [Syntrophobacteraceae bacterium]
MAECAITNGPLRDENVNTILAEAKTIAIVGLSDKEESASNRVARYLGEQGYTIIPVNPRLTEILGEKSYPDLKSIPGHVDVVDIFRNVEAIPAIVDEAIAIKAGAVWMQLDLIHADAAAKACDAGLRVVMDRCMKIEHTRLHGKAEEREKTTSSV